MIIVAIVSGLFAALAVGGMWLHTQYPDELRDMGVVLGYKDEQAVIDSQVGVQQHHGVKRRKPGRTNAPKTGANGHKRLYT